MEKIQEQALRAALCGGLGGEEEPAKKKEKKQLLKLQNLDNCVLTLSEESVSTRKEYESHTVRLKMRRTDS